ncbi:MAG: T9SS C-terminal target domain-containing protein [Bacteroidetes bacterium]|nr:MAG: T9SS C-terminal target domain-containing protein [Bacteroidota bacterium]
MKRLLFLLVAWPLMLPAQSLERFVFDAAGDCVTQGINTYSFSFGEPISGTIQATLPYLTMGFQQPISQVLLSLPLPPLEARAIGEDISLHWTTSQSGYLHFWLEKSEDGGPFAPLAAREGSPFAATYAHTDSQAWRGGARQLRYRLVYTSLGGDMYQGPPVTVYATPDPASGWQLYPVPAATTLQVELPVSEADRISWQILDLRGRRVASGADQTAEKILSLPVGRLANGSYVLVLQTVSRRWQRRFVVAH